MQGICINACLGILQDEPAVASFTYTNSQTPLHEHVVQHVRWWMTNSECVVQQFLPTSWHVKTLGSGLATNEHVVQYVRVVEYTSNNVVQQCSYVALPATSKVVQQSSLSGV